MYNRATGWSSNIFGCYCDPSKLDENGYRQEWWVIWQDAVFAIGQFVFIAALVPALVAAEKPPLTTSIPTTVVLAVYALVFVTLAMFLSAAVAVFSATAWAMLAVQRAAR